MSPGVGFLHQLFDPNLAFIFFWLGLALIVLEPIAGAHLQRHARHDPARRLDRVVRASPVRDRIALPRRLDRVFAIELKAPGLGIWSAAGVVTLVLGGCSCSTARAGARLAGTHRPVALAMAGFFGFVVKASRWPTCPPRRARGRGGSRGRRARRRPDARWRGQVAAEEWKATTDSIRPRGGEDPRDQARRSRAHRRAAGHRARGDRRRPAGRRAQRETR